MTTEKLSKEIKEAFETIEKLNEDSTTLAESALSVVNEYIDTGSLALNAIISGSLYKGIPKGRITGLVGPTGCGKTLILSKIIANAQKADPKVWGLIWDSENAFDPTIAKNVGANIFKIKHNPVETVEECRNQIVAFLDKILPYKELYGKFIIGIDSLGNLASTKEIADSLKDKDATDMGLRAKTIKSMMRSLTYKCAKTNTTLIFTNHIYDDPTSMFPSLVKSQSGGKGPMYLASLLIQLGVRNEKNENNDGTTIPLANKINGITMRALTVKNRFVPPFLETELYLNFKTGLYKYAGLLEMATAYNIIIQNGPIYNLSDGTKLGYLKNWKDDETFWVEKVLPKLDDVLQKQLCFSSTTTTAQSPEIAEMAETTE